jgi:hypothetical protein
VTVPVNRNVLLKSGDTRSSNLTVLEATPVIGRLKQSLSKHVNINRSPHLTSEVHFTEYERIDDAYKKNQNPKQEVRNPVI